MLYCDVDRARRYVECLSFVALWMTLGWAFDLTIDQYLLAGVPLVLIFQLWVRRRPLVQLWVRRARRFRWNATPLVVALMLLPAGVLWEAVLKRQTVWSCLWLIAAVAGAIGAGYSARRQRAWRARRSWRSFAVAAVAGVLIMGSAVALTGRSRMMTEGRIATFLEQLALYFPVCFVLEEVVFRGALDTHVYNRRSRLSHYWTSAVFTSALWGLWHLPVVSVGAHLLLVSAQLVAVHVAIGVPLAICWRKSGTLLLPALAHAIIDAYRNAVFF